jgi:hypothetical protein
MTSESREGDWRSLTVWLLTSNCETEFLLVSWWLLTMARAVQTLAASLFQSQWGEEIKTTEVLYKPKNEFQIYILVALLILLGQIQKGLN